MHRRLGDAVHVDQERPLLAVAIEPGTQTLEIERLAAEDHPTQGEAGRANGIGCVGGDELAEGRRRLIEHRHPFADQKLPERLRRPAHRPRHHHQTATESQGSPQLPH
jgi:hypothetical protein